MIRWWVKNLINKLQTAWESFAETIYANKKTSIIATAVSLVVIIGLTFFSLTMNTKIRAAQMNNLIYESLPTKRVVPFSYDQGDNMISEKKAISVMFAKPNRSDTNQVMEIVDQKNNELNRNFYYYPIVYQSDEIAQTYNINPNEVTFIFFQNGEEKNRFTFRSIDDPGQNFIPELNRLPMWNIQAQED